MAGSVLGAGLQLQQPGLWSLSQYLGTALAGALALWAMQGRRHRAGRAATGPLALLLGMAIAFGVVGARSAIYADGALDPALEGRDLQVVGVVAQMPQRGDGALRFRLDVESARWAGKDAAADAREPLRWPSTIALGWYAENTGLWARPARSDSRPARFRPPTCTRRRALAHDSAAQGAPRQPQSARLRL